jgi:hypothetical protein
LEDGAFLFSGLGEGTYTLTASLEDCFFPYNPAVVAIEDFDVVQKFSCYLPICRVSGTVSGAIGAGVTLTLSFDSIPDRTCLTQDDGTYFFEGLASNVYYYLAATLEGYTFAESPALIYVDHADAVQNFISSASGSTFTVGGTLTNLAARQTITLTLQGNGAHELTLNSNGGYVFDVGLEDGAAYAVTVSDQPGGQNCTVANGEDKISGSNVTNAPHTAGDFSVTAPGTWYLFCRQ